jgi:phosphotriesterase-related protein
MTLTTEEIAGVFSFELTGWLRGEATASVVKVATQHPPLPHREQRAVVAAGLAAANTGAPVICHSETLAAAREQLRLLTDGTGLDPERIVLGHLDTAGNGAGEVAELAVTGAWIGLDRFGRSELTAEADRLALLEGLAERSVLDSVLVSHDAVLHHAGRGALQQPVPYNHALHFHLGVRPELLKRGFSTAQVSGLESGNFARFFGLQTAATAMCCD